MMINTNKSFDVLKLRLGVRIRELRDEKGYSQEYLASLVNMDRVSIGYIEQGRRSPKLSTLHKLAKCLDVKIVELFKDL